MQEINDNNILPPGIKIVPYYDRSDIVSSSVGTVTRALLEGSILVLIVLYFMLRSLRGAAVVILALPLSLFLTFIVMKNVGLDANLMSLGGLAISIGMIIDATIIQVENVQRHLSEKGSSEHKLSTVLKAVLEVRKPSIFGELIIATTFLPILSLEGHGRKNVRSAGAHGGHCAPFLACAVDFCHPGAVRAGAAPGPEKESFVMRGARAVYRPLLAWAMRSRFLVVSGACAAFIAALFVVTRLGTEFIPIMDEGAFDMDVQLLPGISLAKALDITNLVEKKLKRFPELTTVISRTGQTGIALEARGVDKTGFTGIFKPRSEWKTAADRDEMTEKMRDTVSKIPGVAFSFSQPIQCRIDELVAGTRAQLIVKLFGDDMEVLKTKADQIGAVLGGIRGTADLVVERIDGQPYLSINIDRSKIARHGVNASDVLRIIEMSVGGKAATKFYEENRAFEVAVRYPGEYRSSVETIGNTLVPTRDGYNVPLSQLANIEVTQGPVQVSRENGLRRIGIEINIHDRDIGTYVAEAKEAIRNRVKPAAGLFHHLGRTV